VISNARRDFKWDCVKAGIITSKKLNLHSLRKGYGTNMANLGIPANTLKDLMGHSSIVTTMEFYVKTLDENKIAAAEKLNAVAVV
jgi:integrase